MSNDNNSTCGLQGHHGGQADHPRLSVHPGPHVRAGDSLQVFHMHKSASGLMSDIFTNIYIHSILLNRSAGGGKVRLTRDYVCVLGASKKEGLSSLGIFVISCAAVKGSSRAPC